jgi:hypothetical protein
MKYRMTMAMLYPLLAVVVVATYAGGLGVVFMVLNSTELEKWGVVVLGMVILVGVPAAAAILQQRFEKE